MRREAGETGFCGLGTGLRVASVLLHHGEEPPLVGAGGSGTVFLSGCTLRCVFCQNHQISQDRCGRPMSPVELAEEYLRLESRGAVNVNWVTPTPQAPWLVESLAEARARGLTLPVVYNSSGYETLETLRLLDGVVDVYLPDFKYGDERAAVRYSQAPGYPEHALAAVREMFRQVGPLDLRDGVAVRGLIVRHLVLPSNLAATDRVLHLLAEEVSRELSLSLMAQYRPVYRADAFPEINRRITREEYREAVHLAETLGFSQGWHQDLEEIDGAFLPDFDRDEPFGPKPGESRDG